jgi:hypothetical protein
MTASRKLLDAWLPPEGAGRSVACLATTFTFDPDFFEEDCLARFLALDWRRGEGDDLAFLIEQEERLAEVRATVVVDRSYGAEARSLRWDILPVGVRGGVQHAKVSVLVWEHVVRFIVASANLTPAGYRHQLECGLVVDAVSGSSLPAGFFEELIVALRSIVDHAPGNAESPGPKQRARETLDYAVERVRALDLPASAPRRLRAAVALSDARTAALAALDRVWRGGPPRQATVLSPFFDTAPGENVAARALVERLAQRGPVSATFVVPVDELEGRTIVRAPRSILATVPRRVATQFCDVRRANSDDLRRLHAKALVFDSDEWTALVVGSSNFTGAGLGLRTGSGNLEVNVALGAPARSAEAEAFRSLIPVGDRVEPEDADWEPEEDDETPDEWALPLGFEECLVDPGPDPVLVVRLGPDALPSEWTIRRAEGELIFDSMRWQEAGAPVEMRVQLSSDRLPFFVLVEWTEEGAPRRRGWAVNVTEPGRLPPPDELRDLPVEALLRALASTRPMHEALTTELRRQKRISTDPDLDPLRRYSDTGQLFARTRRLSAALTGLQRRLERPASNHDALTWRLRGPFGPLGLAERMADELEGSDRAIRGEAGFLLAELALTLARVDWTSTARIVPLLVVQEEARSVLAEVKTLARKAKVEDPALRRYVRKALIEASL